MLFHGNIPENVIPRSNQINYRDRYTDHGMSMQHRSLTIVLIHCSMNLRAGTDHTQTIWGITYTEAMPYWWF